MPNDYERCIDAPEQYEINKIEKMNKIMQSIIYAGIYEVPPHGVIPLPGSKILVLSAYATEDENQKRSIDNRLTIVVQDEHFWPFVCNLSDEKAKELRNALDEVIRWREYHPEVIPEEQRIVTIGYEEEREEKTWTIYKKRCCPLCERKGLKVSLKKKGKMFYRCPNCGATSSSP